VLKLAREVKFPYAANIEYEMDEKDPTAGRPPLVRLHQAGAEPRPEPSAYWISNDISSTGTGTSSRVTENAISA
jgi:hypothetical protein